MIKFKSKINVFSMWSNEKFLIHISKTNLFNEKIKTDLIKYIDILNEKQKLNLFQALNTERKIMINFLKSLKDEKIYSFEEIKNKIENIHKENRKLMELNEEQNKNTELDNLLNALETT